MGETVNLNKARKRKAREAARRRADANAARHGLSGSQKRLAAEREALERARLEAHRREPPDPEGEA